MYKFLVFLVIGYKFLVESSTPRQCFLVKAMGSYMILSEATCVNICTKYLFKYLIDLFSYCTCLPSFYFNNSPIYNWHIINLNWSELDFSPTNFGKRKVDYLAILLSNSNLEHVNKIGYYLPSYHMHPTCQTLVRQ